MRGRTWAYCGGALAALAVGAVVSATLMGGDSAKAPAPRARQYSSFDVCLLTDAKGVAGAQAAPVWAGMEDASLATHAKVTFLPVFGPATTVNALGYANTLLQQHCDLVLAVGSAPAAAVRQVATKPSTTRFAIVGSGPTTAKVHLIPVGRATRSAVAELVEDAVGEASKR